jgi:hypothetical protein
MAREIKKEPQYNIGLLILVRIGAPVFSGEQLISLTRQIAKGGRSVGFEFVKEFSN